MAAMKSVKGFKDILPDDIGKWHYVETISRKVFSLFGIREIRTPILEKTELFVRGIGAATDIVEKEMYTFQDRGGDLLTLRPEATASVIRAFIEHHLYETDPLVKCYTIGPMFRRERPQKGRFRQFHQINVEYLGQDDPHVDAELIFMLMYLLKELKLEKLSLEINSLGCVDCRGLFRPALLTYLGGRAAELCQDCRRRLETNPLRIFDCKEEHCRAIVKDAPVIHDFLCPACFDHFESVKHNLTLLFVPYTVAPRMVRGLDYYTKTAFEVTAESLGAQNAVTGGGRYDSLVKELGGPDISGVGFAIGVERLISMIPQEFDKFLDYPDLYVAPIGARALDYAFRLSNHIRQKGVRVETDFLQRSLKGHMKRSDRLNCSFTLILGDKELDEKNVLLRNMSTKQQLSVNIEHIDQAAREIADIIIHEQTRGITPFQEKA